MEAKISEGYQKTEFGIIPNEWKIKRLVECCRKITDGTHDTPKPVNQGIPFLTAIHVKDNFIDFDNCYFLPPSVHELIYKRCNPEKNDVLMVNIGAGVANTALVNVEYEFSLKNVALLKANENILIGSYLNYSISFNKSRITNNLLSGGAQPFLSLQQIGKIIIAVPPISEQKVIAQALSDVDATIAELDRLITKKHNIKQGTMQQLLTGKKRLPDFSGEWEEKKLREILDYIKGFAFKSKDYCSDGVRIIRVSDTTYNSVKDENQIYIKSSKLSLYTNWQLQENDLVLSTVGSKPPMYDSMVGKVVFIKKKYAGCLLNQNAVIIRSKYNKYYKQRLIYYHLTTKRYLRYIEVIFRGNANQANITLADLLKFEIVLPPTKEEQQAIAQVLSDMDAEIEALEQKRDKYKAIKQGMMQELLTGRTRLV